MRILMIVMLSFCSGLCASLLPFRGNMLVILALISALLGLVFLIFLRKRELRLILIFFSLAIGLLLGTHYQKTQVAPVQQYIGQTRTVTGIATDYSKPTEYGIQLSANLSLDEISVPATVWFYSDQILKPGDRFTAELRLADSNQDGSFYSYSEGIYLYGYGKTDLSIVPCASMPLRFLPKYIAHKLEDSLRTAFPEDTFGFAMALTTGNRTALSDISKANLKASGIYHALALSGMHLVVLIGMINGLVFHRKKAKALLGIPLCILFTIITGCSASMVRAAVMQSLVLSAYLFRRENDTPTSLSLALGLLMAQNPWCILSWGLQLSFLSVIGMELYSDRIASYLIAKWNTHRKLLLVVRRYLASGLSATFSAMVMTMPLMAVYFGFISLVAPITNLLTDTVINFSFGGSLIVALTGLVFAPLGEIMAYVLSWGFRYVDLMASVMARVPFGQLYTRELYGILALGAIYLTIFFLARKGTKKRILPVCSSLSLLSLIMLLTMLDGTAPTFTALDVGQGQCIVLRHGGGTAMIDCGGNNGNAGDIASEYLYSLGETDLDLLIVTHYDADHIGGIDELMQRVQVKKLALPDTDHEEKINLINLAHTLGTDIYFIRRDTNVYFGGGSLQIFAPLGYATSNESGLSILANMGELEILITGDMEDTTELRLIKEKELPDLDILVAGHHGAKDSTSAALLQETLPDQVVISVGENRYGHPTEEALKRIAATGAVIRRTDLEGSITIKGG